MANLSYARKKRANPKHKLKYVARMSALRILDAGALHKRWTPVQKRQWNAAFNALQALAGVKTRIRRGKLTSKG